MDLRSKLILNILIPNKTYLHSIRKQKSSKPAFSKVLYTCKHCDRGLLLIYAQTLSSNGFYWANNHNSGLKMYMSKEKATGTAAPGPPQMTPGSSCSGLLLSKRKKKINIKQNKERSWKLPFRIINKMNFTNPQKSCS